ncbi:glutamate-cysteine ligase family protein [Arthrobacter pigmenti]
MEDARDTGVLAVNKIRRWLPAIIALSANSPLWNDHDTGFASRRNIHSGDCSYRAPLGTPLSEEAMMAGNESIGSARSMGRSVDSQQPLEADIPETTRDVMNISCLTKPSSSNLMTPPASPMESGFSP